MGLLLTLTFNGELNTSVQPGDAAYWAPTTSQGGFQTAQLSNVICFGIVHSIENNPTISEVKIIYDNGDYNNDGIADIPAPPPNSYIMFGKDKVVNSSSLIGYYAEAKFVNYSTEKVELFSVGSEISESSK